MITPSIEPSPPFLYVTPELPTKIMLPDGKEYNVGGDVWVLPRGIGIAATERIDWGLLRGIITAESSIPVMSPHAVDYVKLYLCERMSADINPLKPNSGNQYLRAMLHLACYLAGHPKWLPNDKSFDWGDLTEEMFNAWLTAEYRTKRKGHSASMVRRFYSWGADPEAGRPNFSTSLAVALNAQSIKGPAAGELVESRDKRRGPFTREELNLIYEACKTGAGTDQDRAITWTLLETAIRPMQMYLLTNRDLEVIEGAAEESNYDGDIKEAGYRLKVRKVRRRGNNMEYHFLPLSEGCAQLLLGLRRSGSRPDDRLFWRLPPSYVDHIIDRLRSFSVDANIRSPRLLVENPEPEGHHNEILHITPRRFRYGVATDRVARGDSLEDVAEMLGHKGTGCVYVYAETSPSIADDFQRATDYAIKPVIDLMEGRACHTDISLLRGAAPPTRPKPRLFGDTPIFCKNTAFYQTSQDSTRSQPASVSVSPVQWLDRSEIRIQELVASARYKFSLLYPGQDFSEQIWKVAHLKSRPNAKSVAKFGFTTIASTKGNRNKLSARQEDALPRYFADVIKSWLVSSNNVLVESNVGRLRSTRLFWDFLSTRLDGSATSFIWGQLSEGDLLAFEQFLMAYSTSRNELISPSSLLQALNDIQRLINFLASHGICRHIDYVSQTRPACGTAVHLLDEKKLIAEQKLPLPDVLESLSSIYHRLTTAPSGEISDWMLIIISAVAILMLTGLRIGELVTLPFDCEVEDSLPDGQVGGTDTYRYGIRYWVEKARKKMMRVKWISPTAEPIVRASVARIKRLTADARERARVLEANPTKVPLPSEFANRAVITREELVLLLGYKRDRPITDPQGLLPQHGTGRKSYFYAADVETYLLSRREPFLYTVHHDDGTFQMLSESLFVIFANQSNRWKPTWCRLLVKPLKANSIHSYLSSPTSLFKIYGGTESQRNLSANPHSLRHWLIHVAYTGGMETHLLLRYFAKRYVSSILDYLHFSTNESHAYAPEELSGEQFYVPV